MINKRAKGRAIELKAKKILQADGYLVEKKNASRFQSDDFWGIYDLVAVKERTVRFIQIKSNKSDFYKARKEIKQFMQDNKQFKVGSEIWLYEGRNKWRKESYLWSMDDDSELIIYEFNSN